MAYTDCALIAITPWQVASGLALLHAQGLCHADIKPENLLLTSRDAAAHVKLVDFGLAAILPLGADGEPRVTGRVQPHDPQRLFEMA